MQQSGREAAFLFSFKQLAMFFANWFRPFSIVFFIFTATAAFSALIAQGAPLLQSLFFDER